MKKSFYSNGKLLLTGEYLVLDGGTAIALPTNLGQSLEVESSSDKILTWKSLDFEGKTWYKGNFGLNQAGEFTSLQTGPWDPISEQLVKLLNSCLALKKGFAQVAMGNSVKTKLGFPRDWGLGSSSTLINNLAQWAEVNPFQLLDRGFGGSGYDIGCAFSDTPISYTKTASGEPEMAPLKLDWLFMDELYFVHLNKKKDSKEGIRQYRDRSFELSPYLQKLNVLNGQFVGALTIKAFNKVLQDHESMIAKLLGEQTVHEELFPDYSLGAMKSLGAWGGDFILVSGNDQTPDYFKSKGYNTIIPFEEMAIKKPPKYIQL